jgi:hypothetical protein
MVQNYIKVKEKTTTNIIFVFFLVFLLLQSTCLIYLYCVQFFFFLVTAHICIQQEIVSYIGKEWYQDKKNKTILRFIPGSFDNILGYLFKDIDIKCSIIHHIGGMHGTSTFVFDYRVDVIRQNSICTIQYCSYNEKYHYCYIDYHLNTSQYHNIYLMHISDNARYWMNKDT